MWRAIAEALTAECEAGLAATAHPVALKPREREHLNEKLQDAIREWREARPP